VKLLLTIMCVGLLFPASVQGQVLSLEGVCEDAPVEFQAEQGVEYIPGAEEVTPADINPLNAAVPDAIEIPIDVILSERFDNAGIDAGLELNPAVSSILVHKNGRVQYNGQDITSQISSLCGKEPVVSEKEEAVKKPNGQQGSDVLKSSKSVEPNVVETKKTIEGEVLKDEVLEGQYP